MKIESLPYCFLALVFLILPLTAYSQSSAVPWSAFSGGFGVASSTNTTVQASTGEIVGTTEGGNTAVKSGFLVVRLQQELASAIIENDELPLAYALHPNYPNPFNPVTSIHYNLPYRAEVTLTVYDILGREVRTLLRGEQGPGYRSVIWDGTDNLGCPVSSGVYLYRLDTKDFSQTNKMILLR